MRESERQEILKANYLQNIKCDLLFILAIEKQLNNCKTRKERKQFENKIDSKIETLAKEVYNFFMKYSDFSCVNCTLGELRFRIFLWYKENNFFDDITFNLLKTYFVLQEEYIEDLKETDSVPVYEFRSKKWK